MVKTRKYYFAVEGTIMDTGILEEKDIHSVFGWRPVAAVCLRQKRLHKIYLLP